MIENVQQSRGPAFRFAVRGLLTEAATQKLTTQLEHLIGSEEKPIGVMADLTLIEGADWTARWNEMRLLQRHTSQIAKLAIVGDSAWEGIASMVLVATAALQAQTLYFLPSEIVHAWQWVKMVKHDDEMPVQMLYSNARQSTFTPCFF